MNIVEKQKYIFNILNSIANYITNAQYGYIQNISMSKNNLIEFKVYFDQEYFDDIINRIKYVQNLLPNLNIQIRGMDYDTQNFLQIKNENVKMILDIKLNMLNDENSIYETITVLKLVKLYN